MHQHSGDPQQYGPLFVLVSKALVKPCGRLECVPLQYCGLSLGWPLVQCQLVVSSTWALLYYKEVTQ